MKFIVSLMAGSGLFNVLAACTYCAAQDSSETINLALVPLGILGCIPFGLFGLFILYLKTRINRTP